MTVNNALVKAIKKYILSGVNRTEIVNELNRYKKEFSSVLDYNWYMYGNIMPYYTDIREFYTKNGFTFSDDSDDSDELLLHFKFHIRYAIDEILAEGGK